MQNTKWIESIEKVNGLHQTAMATTKKNHTKSFEDMEENKRTQKQPVNVNTVKAHR